MDTDSQDLALSEENLEYNIFPAEKTNGKRYLREIVQIAFKATGNFFPRTCCTAHKKHDKGERGLFIEDFMRSEKLWLCSKTYCCYDWKRKKYKFSSKGLNKRTVEDWWWTHVKVSKNVRRGSQR